MLLAHSDKIPFSTVSTQLGHPAALATTIHGRECKESRAEFRERNLRPQRWHDGAFVVTVGMNGTMSCQWGYGTMPQLWGATGQWLGRGASAHPNTDFQFRPRSSWSRTRC